MISPYKPLRRELEDKLTQANEAKQTPNDANTNGKIMKLPGDSETSPRIEKVPTETLGYTKLYTEGFRHIVQIGSKISRSYKFSLSAKQTPSTHRHNLNRSEHQSNFTKNTASVSTSNTIATLDIHREARARG